MDMPARAGGAEAAALLDRALIDELAGDYGAEMLAELAQSLREEAGEEVAALKAAAAAGDAAAARARLHALRGAALNLGLAAFAAAAGDQESAAAAGRPPAPGEVARLIALLDVSLDAFDAVAAPA